jgi:GNAT superfamily N-acetyltransferase
MYTLRPATADDYDFLRRLHRATMLEYVERTWGWDEDVQAAMFRERFDPAREQIVVVDGSDVGVLRVERRVDQLFLAELLIAPAHQGHGLGGAILADLRAEAARAGLPVTLQVVKVNPARRFYERHGLRVTGETATHYLMST